MAESDLQRSGDWRENCVMGYDETLEKLCVARERKRDLETHVLRHSANQSSSEYLEWQELKDRITDLEFGLRLEQQLDPFGVERF